MTRAHGKKNPPRGTDPGPGTPGGLDIGESTRQEPDGWINTQTGNIVNHETERQSVLTIPYTRDEYAGWMAHGVPNESDTTEGHAFTERGGRSRQIGTNVPVKPVVRPTPIPVYIAEYAGGGKALTTMATNRVLAPAQGTESNRLTARDETRRTMYVLVENVPTVSNVVVTPPSVPATTVAAQNKTGYVAQVVIAANGATITAVTVNGINVGSAAGTYVVPVAGSIAITYTVATPTWTWTELNVPGTAPTGVRIDHEVSTLDVGEGALIPVGGYVEIKGCQDEMFVVSNDSSTPYVSVIYIYELAGAL